MATRKQRGVDKQAANAPAAPAQPAGEMDEQALLALPELEVTTGSDLIPPMTGARRGAGAPSDLGARNNIQGAVEVVVDGIPLWLDGSSLGELLTDQGQLRRYGARGERGLRGDAVESVRELMLGKAMGLLADFTADQLCQYLDRGKPVDGRLRHGLWQCGEDRLHQRRIDRSLTRSDKPILLLLHGFASSVAGSFAGLLEGEGRSVYRRLYAQYAGQIYAFDHRTVGKDPLHNADELLALLPSQQEIHVLSYSRGGLIADLLSCAAGTRWPKVLAGDPLQERFDDFQDALATRDLRVTRLVRVAAPMAGTALASDRLDQWLSYVRFGLKLATASVPWLQQSLDIITQLLALVAEKRLSAEDMPGCAAMHPQSSLLAALAAGQAQPEQTLTIIAGDCVGAGIWRRLKLAIVDAFHGSDHDLVVPTAGMTRGLRRERTPRYYFAQYPGVDHFRYFSLADTLTRIERGLCRDYGADDGFQRLDDGGDLLANRAARSARKPRPGAPLTVLLPGIMGSSLARKNDTIWVGLNDLCLGEFAALRLPPSDWDSPTANKASGKVFAEAPLDYWPANFYGKLLDALAAHGDVVLPFGYDWRRPIARSADALAEALRQQWQPGQHLRLICHSMGGLVARVLLHQHPDLRARFVADPRCRLLMLGTPNSGSLAILKALLGGNDTLQTIERLAPQSQRQLLEIAATFAGFFELLPQGSAWDQAMLDQLLTTGPKPRLLPEVLALAAKGRQLLQAALASLPRAQCHYVAGVADPRGENATIVGYRLQAGSVAFVYGPGDGTVAHEGGILQDVDTYYTDALHGDLASHRKAFADYLRLLDGQAAAPGQALGVLRRSASEVRARSGAGLELLGTAAAGPSALPPGMLMRPSPAELVYGLFHRMYPEHTLCPAQPKLRVRVVHGDIGLARFPILVGHYHGYRLQGAEGRLDRLYGGLLQRNVDLGTYPGAIESFAVFGDDDKNRRRYWRQLNGGDTPYEPPSTIVVGLGAAGELSVGQLARTVKRGLLAWHGDDAQPRESAGFSVVLAGVNSSGLSVAECLRGVIGGVIAACDALRMLGIAPPTDLDVHELYEDRAQQATHALLAVAQAEDPLGARIEAARTLQSKKGWKAIAGNLPGGQYTRLDIARRRSGRLRFALPGIQSALPIHHRQVDWRELDLYVEEGRTGGDGVGDVLFQQLFPRALKRYALEQYRLVLQLGDLSAAVPWELMRSDALSPPLAVTSGMLRQLRDLGYQPMERAFGNFALVIGDPESALPALPGAQTEAAQVAELLSAHGYEVTYLPRPSCADVRRALGAKHYRLLHFAGHGVVNDRGPDGSEPPRTGLVLGSVNLPEPKSPTAPVSAQGMRSHLLLLTADDLEQCLLSTPEVMFLNCCYGGQFGMPSAEHGRASLASNIARACIKLGARAVVAAGWAVDDADAQQFAAKFYIDLLQGRAYFDAVRSARTSIYPGNGNTYGAYQCYGDPDYTMESRVQTGPNCGSATELSAVIDNLGAKAQGLRATDCGSLRQALQDLLESHAELAKGPDVHKAVVYCLVELGAYHEGLAKLDAWLSATDEAEFPREMLRWRPLLALRVALRQNAMGAEPSIDSESYRGHERMALGNILRRIYLLRRQRQHGNAVAALQQHVEVQLDMWTQLGARSSRVYRDEVVPKAFNCAQYARLLLQPKRLPNSNQTAAFRKAVTPAIRQIDNLRARCLEQLRRNLDPSEYWDDNEVPDLKLMLWLDQELRDVPPDLYCDFGVHLPADTICGDYRFSIAQSATPKERESVLTFVEFHLAILRHFAPAGVVKRLQPQLDQIEKCVRELQ